MKVEVPISKLVEWKNTLEWLLSAPEKKRFYLSEYNRRKLHELLVWLQETLEKIGE